MRINEISKLRIFEKNQNNKTKEVVCFMKKTWMLAILVGLAIGILLCQVPAYSAVICPATENNVDTDKDGFTDYQECYGITLIDGTSICGSVGCGGSTTPVSVPARADRLDPDTQDLFVILIPAVSNSNFSVNPLEFVNLPKSSGGLGITTHQISETQADPNRWVIANGQKTVKIREDLNACGTYPCNTSVCACDLGMSYRGTVKDGLDNATIYTERIKKEIILAYGSLAAAPAGFYEKYMKHTIAHELAHMLSLTLSSTNSYHYAAKSNYILDQYVYRKGTTWVLGTKFSTTDQSGLKMVP